LRGGTRFLAQLCGECDWDAHRHANSNTDRDAHRHANAHSDRGTHGHTNAHSDRGAQQHANNNADAHGNTDANTLRRTRSTLLFGIRVFCRCSSIAPGNRCLL